MGAIVTAVFSVIGIITSEVVLIARTVKFFYWRIRAHAEYLHQATFASIIVFASLEVASWTYGLSPFPEITACFLTGASKIIFVAYVTLILFETCLVIMTMIKGVHHMRQTHSTWIRKMYQDGKNSSLLTYQTQII
ncbi:hypothetical protein HWV62_14350 [Athelia sp. TMB]|nr:hypothetical protein HWV62_14350 [Athelia sp. TMB]